MPIACVAFAKLQAIAGVFAACWPLSLSSSPTGVIRAPYAASPLELPCPGLRLLLFSTFPFKIG